MAEPGGTQASSQFFYRAATAEDKGQVLSFTTNIWEHGDYIAYVYDDWLADKSGRFLVAVETVTGRIAAIDKLSFIRPGEAWFEGLRVNPEFRGRGLASRTQRHMLKEARGLGAHTIRLLTRADNHAVHTMAYRDGFRLLMITRFWRWKHDSQQTYDNTTGTVKLHIREAEPSEAAGLYAWHGLVYGDWRFESTTPGDWAEAARAGGLFVATDYSQIEMQVPPPLALVSSVDYGPEADRWLISTFGGQPDDLTPLLRTLVERANVEGACEIRGFYPDTVEINRALVAAGFEAGTDEERHLLFELELEP